MSQKPHPVDVGTVVNNYKLVFVSQGYNKVDKRLVITTCANQDPLQATTGKLQFNEEST